jgi:hypothetical protein
MGAIDYGLKQRVRDLEGHVAALATTIDSVVSGGGGGGGGVTTALDFVSLGDANGIFYFLGTNGLSQAFSNPVPGVVAVSDSGVFSPWNPTPTPVYLTDRDSTVNIFHSSADTPHWILWDFGTGAQVKIRDYTVKNRWDQGVYFPTRFILEGSHDGAAWDLIDDSTVNYTLLDQWARPALDHPNLGPYRYIRLSDPGDPYLVLGEVEFYGDLVR